MNESAVMTARPATSAKTNSVLKGKRAAVLLFGVYPNDARPRLEAEALVRQGMDVEVICLREHDSEPQSRALLF